MKLKTYILKEVLFMRSVSVFTRNSCIRAEVIKTVRNVCGKCFAIIIERNLLIVKGECTDEMYQELKAQLIDVVSPKLIAFS